MIRAADAWPTNAEMLKDVAKLYIKDGANILDPTYGQGIWYKALVEAVPEVSICAPQWDGWDFTRMTYQSTGQPLPSNFYDAVAFDPPYCAKGGRTTSGIKDMDKRYGMDDAPATPAELQNLINKGLDECERVLKPGGILLVKCMNYISSGQMWPGVFETYEYAYEGCILEVLDCFIHVGSPGPQPTNRRQVHARNNYSVLLVFEKPKQPPKPIEYPFTVASALAIVPTPLRSFSDLVAEQSRTEVMSASVAGADVA